MLKENKGVTLVALVITIIVLLILAGVTLAMVMGDSGIFGKANKASVNTNTSSAESAVSLAVLEATTAQYDDATGDYTVANAVTTANANEKVGAALKDYTLEAVSSKTNEAYVKKGDKYVVNEDGNKLKVTFTVDTTKHTVTPAYSYNS